MGQKHIQHTAAVLVLPCRQLFPIPTHNKFTTIECWMGAYVASHVQDTNMMRTSTHNDIFIIINMFPFLVGAWCSHTDPIRLSLPSLYILTVCFSCLFWLHPLFHLCHITCFVPICLVIVHEPDGGLSSEQMRGGSCHLIERSIRNNINSLSLLFLSCVIYVS